MEIIQNLLHRAEFWVLVGFVLFVAIAFNPLRKALMAQINNHIDNAKNILAEAEALRNEAARVLAAAKHQRQNIQAECAAILAKTEADAAALITKAEIECDRIIGIHRRAAMDKITQAEAQARANLRVRTGQFIISATHDVMKKQMEGRLASALIDQAIAKIPGKISS